MRLDAIPLWLEAFAIRSLKAIAIGFEGIAISSEAIAAIRLEAIGQRY